MSGVELITVAQQDDGMRLNRWFLKYYPHLPLAHLQKLLRTKQIKVDGKKCDISVKLFAGTQIRIPPLEEKAKEVTKNGVSERDAAWIRSMVIYRDENIIVLNKPSGLAVQGGTNTKRHIDGMLEALAFEKPQPPKLVHRIDKDTSGILVLARDRKNAELLTRAFKSKNINKTYLAIVCGNVGKHTMVVDVPLLKKNEKMVADKDGQSAISEVKMLDCAGEKFALLELGPKTGRTHQLRAHMEYIGTPILGDDKYFGTQRQKFSEISDKLYLHAYKIDLSDIYKNVVIKADPPEYFKAALQVLGLKLKNI